MEEKKLHNNDLKDVNGGATIIANTDFDTSIDSPGTRFDDSTSLSYENNDDDNTSYTSYTSTSCTTPTSYTK